jgi:hypothetical protein
MVRRLALWLLYLLPECSESIVWLRRLWPYYILYKVTYCFSTWSFYCVIPEDGPNGPKHVGVLKYIINIRKVHLLEVVIHIDMYEDLHYRCSLLRMCNMLPHITDVWHSACSLSMCMCFIAVKYYLQFRSLYKHSLSIFKDIFLEIL